MTQEGRPTGIRYEAALNAARRGGRVEFEGLRAEVVRVTVKSSIDTTHTLRALSLLWVMSTSKPSRASRATSATKSSWKQAASA